MASQIARVHSAHTSPQRPDGLTGVAGVTALEDDPNVGHIDVVQGVPVVRLTGELDLLSRNALQRLLRSVVASDANTVVVDTDAVTFIDCAGLHPLVQAAVQLRRRQAFF